MKNIRHANPFELDTTVPSRALLSFSRCHHHIFSISDDTKHNFKSLVLV